MNSNFSFINHQRVTLGKSINISESASQSVTLLLFPHHLVGTWRGLEIFCLFLCLVASIGNHRIIIIFLFIIITRYILKTLILVIHQAQPGPRSLCLLPNVEVGETAPGSLGTWCWIPVLLQRYVCPQMDAKSLSLSSRVYERVRDALSGHLAVTPWKENNFIVK